MSKLMFVLALVSSLYLTTAEASVIRPGVGTGLVGKDLTDPEDDGQAEEDVNYNAVFRTSSRPGFGGAENAFNVFDNHVGSRNNKWCCDPKGWVEADFGSQRYVLTSFTASSANDKPGRDSNEWMILGSNDGVNYTPIYTYSAPESIWTDRLQTIQFFAGEDFATPAAYSIFRYQSISTVDKTEHQLAELEFFGTPAAEVPEPASLLLMGLGALGLAVRRRRG